MVQQTHLGPSLDVWKQDEAPMCQKLAQARPTPPSPSFQQIFLAVVGRQKQRQEWAVDGEGQVDLIGRWAPLMSKEQAA